MESGGANPRSPLTGVITPRRRCDRQHMLERTSSIKRAGEAVVTVASMFWNGDLSSVSSLISESTTSADIA